MISWCNIAHVSLHKLEIIQIVIEHEFFNLIKCLLLFCKDDNVVYNVHLCVPI